MRHRHAFSLLLFACLILTRPAHSAPITPERIATLPAVEQPAWRSYIVRSQSAARENQAALDAELGAQKMSVATRAPEAADFKLPAQRGDAWYVSDDARRLADTILSYQTPSGGWSKHTAYDKGPRKPGMLWSSQYAPEQKPHYLATFDNRSTTEQMQFLAAMWGATKREDCKEGFRKGLQFIFNAQFPNGGWPQVYPIEGGYHDSITFNDDAMTHVLELLRDIASGDSRFAFVDEPLRKKSAAAFDAGLRCVLQTQVVQNGKKSVWCAQYDALTLQPAAARKMEPAMLSGLESVRILEFLMSLKNPSPEIIAAIEAGLDWFETKKITGIGRVQRDGKTIYEPIDGSTEIYWARFYRVSDSKPVFPGRDGVIYETFATMAAANKLGYAYYTTIPASLLNTAQKKWRKQFAVPPAPDKKKRAAK